MKCPYCSEEIQDGAKKCRYCNEWLEGKEIKPLSEKPGPEPLDNSKLKKFNVLLTKKEDPETPRKIFKFKDFFSVDESDVKKQIQKKYPDFSIDEGYGIKAMKESEGKYSCPNCKAKITKCERKIGCAVLIVIFVSLGIGLIMIPFLPYHCECRVCGYKWKS